MHWWRCAAFVDIAMLAHSLGIRVTAVHASNFCAASTRAWLCDARVLVVFASGRAAYISLFPPDVRAGEMQISPAAAWYVIAFFPLFGPESQKEEKAAPVHPAGGESVRRRGQLRTACPLKNGGCESLHIGMLSAIKTRYEETVASLPRTRQRGRTHASRALYYLFQ